MFPLNAPDPDDTMIGATRVRPAARGRPRLWPHGPLARRVARLRDGPDRRFLADVCIPLLAAEGGWILWIGCRPDTVDDCAALEAGGGIVWTLDRDAASARWGQPGRHRIGDIWEADHVYASLRFDTVICDGVFGYGVDAPSRQRLALAAIKALLNPGGRLLLGWGVDASDDPREAGLAPAGLTPMPLAGKSTRMRFDAAGRVYDSFVKLY